MNREVAKTNCKILFVRNILPFKMIAYVMLFFFPAISFAQSNILPLENTKTKLSKKGNMYIYWGWNREWYANSALHLKGDGYDFVLKNVSARDRQSPFNAKLYLNPSSATIPQYNFRVGYFINDKFNISLGVDHMKYIVIQNQTVNIVGNINNSKTDYNGQYKGESIVLKEELLKLEHTDGLNFINIDLRRSHDCWSTNKVAFNVLAGLGAGILLPRTDATVLGKPRHDEFHLSGFGISGVVGINVSICKYFFIQSEYKIGYISMPDILTTYEAADRADQKILFSQYNVVFGSNIYL